MIFKVLKFFILFIISIHSTFAQVELVDGMEWQYLSFGYNSGEVYEYKNFIEGDTIINDITCKKLKREAFNCNQRFTLEEYIYIDDDKLYYYHFEDSLFQLLYDFNPEIGDTIKIRNWGYFTNDASHFYLRVDSVKQVNLNGKMLNEIYALAGRDDGAGIEFVPYTYKYIEGVGTDINFFYITDTGWCDGLHVTELYCYFHPDHGSLVFNPEECNLAPVGISELKNEFKVNVFPNPTNDFINLKIESEAIDNYLVQFFNSTGQQIYQNSIPNNKIEIDISNFPTGIYYYRVINQNSKKRFFGKINCIPKR